MKQSKQVFEVVLPGFDGGTDETDHLVRWVAADSEDQVRAKYPEAQVSPLEITTDIDEVL